MLRIPTLTTEDYFRLEDFQNDFNYLEGLHNSLADLHNTDIEAIKKSHSLDFTTLLGLLTSVSNIATRYGISGNAMVDDTDKIQEFINKRGNLYFPKGTYNLSKMINIYSNTTITLHPEAVFIRKHAGVMFQTATTTETIDYNGEKNIRINGGTYKHNGDVNPSNILTLFHADDVVINDVTFLDTVGAHCLDIVGSKDIKIFNCKFKGYVATVTDPAKEAIQIDAAGCNSYPIYADTSVPAYDGTPTRDVTIENCIFCKSDTNPSYPTAIGQHGQVKLKGSRYKNIKILNNLMIGDTTWIYSYGIRAISWEDALIDGNTIENYKVSIFADLYSSVLDPHGENLKGETNHVVASDEDIYYIACRNITISNNVLKSGVSTHSVPGIWFNIAGSTLASSLANSPKHRGLSITGNTIYMPSPLVKSYGIDLDTTEDVIVSNNTFINNAKADSIAVGCQDYSKNIVIGDNVYKGITEENIVYIKSNAENIKKKGRTVLWEGKAYNGRYQLNGTSTASGEIITLSDNMFNYDHLLFEFTYSGFEFKIVDFRSGDTQTLRTINLSDAGNSTVWGASEFVIVRNSDTTIEIYGNKMQNMSNNSITMNSSGLYISKITGINY